MSVYQLDILRVKEDDAVKIAHFLKENEEKNPEWISGLNLTKMKDESYVFDWETWHGGPVEDILSIINKETSLLHIQTNGEGELGIFENLAPSHWIDSWKTVKDEEGNEFPDAVEFGKKIKLEDLLERSKNEE